MTMQNMSEYLSTVQGVIEATDFERLMLWKDYSNSIHPSDGRLRYSWKDYGYGFLPCVGSFHGRQIVISIMKVKVDGYDILFWHPTSVTVDHRIINSWLEKNLPPIAFRTAGPESVRTLLNKTDPINFTNIFRYIEDQNRPMYDADGKYIMNLEKQVILAPVRQLGVENNTTPGKLPKSKKSSRAKKLDTEQLC